MSANETIVKMVSDMEKVTGKIDHEAILGRAGGQYPYSFCIHPRTDAKTDAVTIIPFLKLLSKDFLERNLWKAPCLAYPNKASYYREGKEPAGWNILVPMTSSMMYRKREYAIEKITQGILLAKRMGAGNVGFGAITSPIMNGGLEMLNWRKNSKEARTCGIFGTNGNTMTVYDVITGVERTARLLRHNAEEEYISIIGAGGSIAQAVSRIWAIQGRKLILIENNVRRMDALKEKIAIEAPSNNQIIYAKSVDEKIDSRDTNGSLMRKSTIKVVLVATAGGQVIQKHHLNENDLVYDDTVPKATSRSLKEECPSVVFVDGGNVEVSGFKLGCNIGLLPNRIYMCYTETMILAKRGIRRDFLGDVDIRNVPVLGQLFEEEKEYFRQADFTSFGEIIKF